MVPAVGAQSGDAGVQFAVLGINSLGQARGRRDVGRINDPHHVISDAADAGPFGVVEEEQLIFDGRSAEGESEVISCELRLRQTLRVVKEGVGSQRRHTVELISGAVEGIGAGLCSYVDDAGGGASCLSREVAGGDADFLHRIHWDHLSDSRIKLIIVRDAVQKDVCTG